MEPTSSLGTKNPEWSCHFRDKGEIMQSFLLSCLEFEEKGTRPQLAASLVTRVTTLHPNIHNLLDRLHSYYPRNMAETHVEF